MDLAKQRGAPLSDKEHQQRVNAARARWAAAATGAGALIGGNVGFAHHVLVTRPEIAGRRFYAAHTRAVNETQQQAADRAERFAAAIRARKRPTRETPRQRHNRIFGASGGEGSDMQPGPPAIGSARTDPTAIYDYEIDQVHRRLRSDQAALPRLEAKETAAFESGGEPLSAQETRDLRTIRANIQDRTRQIAQLQRLKDRANARIVREAHLRAGTEVPATIVRQYRGAERLAVVQQRRARQAGVLDDRLKNFVERNQQRTERIIPKHVDQAIAREATAIRQSILHGELRGKLLRATGKGALIGAGLGLTVAGIGILAHHVASSGRQQLKSAEKLQPIGALAKARRPRAGAEQSIASGLAQTYRAWIDRLLGRSEDPANLGDGVARAMAPGISQAFAQGAATPPVDTAGSHPNWSVETDFDVLNPSVRRHMASYALDRIVQITQDQRDAIRSALMNQAVLQGEGPPDVARTIKQTIGLTSYQSAVVQSFRSQLQQLDPRVLERKLRDRRYDRTLRRAIEQNEPLTDAQIDTMEDAYHRRMIALRAMTIARTEALRATTYGALARAQEVLDLHPELTVVKRWLATDDERTRDTHRDLNGREVEGIETPFITSNGASVKWPLDQDAPADETINCRCSCIYKFVPKRGQLQMVPV
jgi:hypothetical protein